MTVTIPLRTISPNVREHPFVRSKRVKAERGIVRMYLNAHMNRRDVVFPCVVTLTRIGAKALDSHDNLRGSFKGTVDEITAWLGLASDADPKVEWQYRQDTEAYKQTKQYRITVEIELWAP